MKATEFCYWLQGMFELGRPEALNAETTAAIKAHLDLVFIHEIDPSYPASQQDALNAAHKPSKPVIGGKIGDVMMRC